MYSITKTEDGKYACAVVIQDGTEYWTENSLQEAIYSVISSAKILNGSYIREDDICIKTEVLKQQYTIEKSDYELLQKIKSKNLIVLDHDDLRLKYRISPKECEMIIKIREGKLIVKEKE